MPTSTFSSPVRRRLVLRVGAVVALLFGLATVVSGARVLLADVAAREGAGAYVPFVVWFNFLAGFAYVVAAAGLWLDRPWAGKLAFAIAALTVIAFAAFGVHVLSGGAYEMRTVAAMTLRSLVWCALAWLALRRP